MHAERIHARPTVSRPDAEAKLIEIRNKFLGFLRKRLRNPQDAEDVFQDFCLKVLRNHASIKSGDRLDAWLTITLKHTLSDHYRRQATRNRATEAYGLEASILGAETDPVSESVGEPACSCVRSAIRELKPEQAELLTRLDLREEPRDAIAAKLAVSQNTLRVRVHRARLALKENIAGICPTCGDGRFMECDCEHARRVHSPTEMAI